MKQEPNRTLVRTFVGIYWDMVENVRNTRRLYQESYDPNTNVIGYHSFGHSIQHCYHCQDSGTITTIHLRTNRALSYKPVTNLLFVYIHIKHVLYQHPGAVLAYLIGSRLWQPTLNTCQLEYKCPQAKSHRFHQPKFHDEDHDKG